MLKLIFGLHFNFFLRTFLERSASYTPGQTGGERSRKVLRHIHADKLAGNVPGRFLKKIEMVWLVIDEGTSNNQASSKQAYNNDDVAEQPSVTGLLPRAAGVVPREAVRRHLRSQDELQGRQEVEP